MPEKDQYLKQPLSKQAFFDQVYAEAKKLRDAGAPINPAIVAAQASLESNYGSSGLSRQANNYFGIKSTPSWEKAGGKVFRANTGEHVNGRDIRINAGFRQYDDFSGCLKDYSEKVVKAPWYAHAVKNADNPYEYAKGIAFGDGRNKWATDPEYYNKIVSIARRHAPEDFSGKPEGHTPIVEKNVNPATTKEGYKQEYIPVTINNNSIDTTEDDNAALATLKPKSDEKYYPTGFAAKMDKTPSVASPPPNIQVTGLQATGTKTVATPHAKNISAEVLPPNGKRVRPIDGSARLTSDIGMRWGRMHRGIDLAAPEGTPVRAVMDGVVRIVPADSNRGGNRVYIRHPDGTETRYMHLSGFNSNLKDGQVIGAGTIIGTVGNTAAVVNGAVTPSGGNHLHFEYLKPQSPNNIYYDPKRFL